MNRLTCNPESKITIFIVIALYQVMLHSSSMKISKRGKQGQYESCLLRRLASNDTNQDCTRSNAVSRWCCLFKSPRRGYVVLDWHGWMGHDPDVCTPHVPGHELIGKIVATGKDVQRWQIGERVTVPFVGGCDHCEQCQTGNQQVCNAQLQPGFTHWGSLPELVTIKYADTNLVQLPGFLTDVAAASLGCRFVTAFRGLMDQGRLGAGQWVAVHGCGGVGLSAIMIAHAVGANIIAIDIDDKKLQLAKTLGANYLLHGRQVDNIGQAIKGLTGGGAHVSMDALGHPETCVNSVSCLRKRVKRIQVGLLVGDQSTPPIPMNLVVAHELEILGSHGIEAHQYKRILNMIETGKLTPEQLIHRHNSPRSGPHTIDGDGSV